ncbi:hypothetical protein PanWU01x14_363380, partial [Parasponia andersonii]
LNDSIFSVVLFLQPLVFLFLFKRSTRSYSSFSSICSFILSLVFHRFILRILSTGFYSLQFSNLNPCLGILYLPHKMSTLNLNPTEGYIIKSNLIIWLYVFFIFLFISFAFFIS